MAFNLIKDVTQPISRLFLAFSRGRPWSLFVGLGRLGRSGRYFSVLVALGRSWLPWLALPWLSFLPWQFRVVLVGLVPSQTPITCVALVVFCYIGPIGTIGPISVTVCSYYSCFSYTPYPGRHGYLNKNAVCRSRLHFPGCQM